MARGVVTERTDRREYRGAACALPALGHVGWARFAHAETALGAHAHERAWEICYIVKGNVEWWAGARGTGLAERAAVREVHGGQIYLTRPGERHGGVDAVMHPCELYWVQVRVGGRHARQAAGRLLAACGKHRVFDAPPRVPEIFEQMLAEHKTPGPGQRALLQALLDELVVLTVRAHAAHDAALATRGPMADGVRAALTWMDGHWHEEFRVAELARRVGLSASHFHALFVRQTGLSPAEMRTRRRMQAAKQLLRQTRLPVTAIAQRVGFATSQYFATAFRQATGMAPGAYRRRAAEAETEQRMETQGTPRTQRG